MASEQTRLSSVHGARCLGIVPFSRTGSVRRQAHDRGTGAVVLVVPRAQELADTCVLLSTQEGVPPARPAHGGPCEAAQQLGSSPPSRQKVAPCHQISKRSGFRGLSTSPPVSSFPWLRMQEALESAAWRAPPPNLVPMRFLFLEMLLVPSQALSLPVPTPRKLCLHPGVASFPPPTPSSPGPWGPHSPSCHLRPWH